jgi:hypothetical protein
MIHQAEQERMYSQCCCPADFDNGNHYVTSPIHEQNVSNNPLVVEDCQQRNSDNVTRKSFSRKRQRSWTDSTALVHDENFPTPRFRFTTFALNSASKRQDVSVVESIVARDDYHHQCVRLVGSVESRTRDYFTSNQSYCPILSVNQEVIESYYKFESNEKQKQILDASQQRTHLQRSKWKSKTSNRGICDKRLRRSNLIRLLTMLSASVVTILAHEQSPRPVRFDSREQPSYRFLTLDTSYDNFVNNSLFAPILQWQKRFSSDSYHHNQTSETPISRVTASMFRFLSSYSNTSSGTTSATSTKYSSSASNSSTSTGSSASSSSKYSSSYNSSSSSTSGSTSTSTNSKYSSSYNNTTTNSTSTNSKYSSSYDNSNSNSSTTTSSGTKSTGSAYSSSNSSSSSSTSGKYSSGYSNSSSSSSSTSSNGKYSSGYSNSSSSSSSTSSNGKYSTSYGSNSSTTSGTSTDGTSTSSSKYSSGYSSTSGEYTDASNSNNSIAVSPTIDPNKGLQQTNSFCKRSLIKVLSLRLLCNSPGAYYAGSNAYRKSDVCQAGDKAILEVECKSDQMNSG